MDMLFVLGSVLFIVAGLLLLKLGERTPANFTGGTDGTEGTEGTDDE